MRPCVRNAHLSPLQDEAVAGRQRTSEDVANLVPQSRDDPNVRPPYASNQISETAMFREIHRIYENASPWTRPIYDRGWYADGPNRDNWIIRWCLWHVFRYRDNRNKQRWSKSSARSSQPNSPIGNRSRSRKKSPVAGSSQDQGGSTGSRSQFIASSYSHKEKKKQTLPFPRPFHSHQLILGTFYFLVRIGALTHPR